MSTILNAATTHSKFLIIGQGDIGLSVTNKLCNQGYKVTGLARGVREDYKLDKSASFIQADATKLTADVISDFTHITIIVTPDEYDVQAYKSTYYGITKQLASLVDALPNLERIVFISSTGVYGQDKGEWIDETVTPTKPKREASQYILTAEQVLQQAFGKRAVIIRPSGIYGKDRLMRIRKAQASNKEAMTEYAWTNRVMDTDLVNIITNVLSLKDNLILKPIYLATDYMPVTSYELTKWLCQHLGFEPPRIKDTIQDATGKRLHSNIPRHWLEYPDWQAGYRMILKNLDKDEAYNSH